MAVGAGIYDDLCTEMREKADAAAAIIIIFNGYKGNGFSVQTSSLPLTITIPDVLEEIAYKIRNDTSELKELLEKENLI